jgi:hypothetical protein
LEWRSAGGRFRLLPSDAATAGRAGGTAGTARAAFLRGDLRLGLLPVLPITALRTPVALPKLISALLDSLLPIGCHRPSEICGNQHGSRPMVQISKPIIQKQDQALNRCNAFPIPEPDFRDFVRQGKDIRLKGEAR